MIMEVCILLFIIEGRGEMVDLSETFPRIPDILVNSQKDASRDLFKFFFVEMLNLFRDFQIQLKLSIFIAKIVSRTFVLFYES